MRSFALFLLLTTCAFGADSNAQMPHVRNLGTVNNHLLRGAEPSPAALSELAAGGVKIIIDLREPGPNPTTEKSEAEKLGIVYNNIPLAPFGAPSQAQVSAILKLISDDSAQTIFVHCRRGKDRTGTIIACYRIQHDGWDNQRALEEARSFGMSSLERSMQAFVLHFTPTLAPTAPALLH